MEEIFLKLFFGDEVGGFVVMLGEHPHRAGVAFLRPFCHTVQLQGLDGLLVPVFHDHTLLVK